MTATAQGSKRRFLNQLSACPICGGWSRQQGGQGLRCWGFESEDWIHCTREERAGQAPYNANSQTYRHRRNGNCACGQSHGYAPLGPVTRSPAPSARVTQAPKAPADPTEYEKRGVAWYQYTDRIKKERIEIWNAQGPTGRKSFMWWCDGKPGLKGIDARTLPFYDPGNVLARERDGSWSVLIVEGEKSVDWLTKRGIRAICNGLGAPKISHAEVFESLKGIVPVQWPDNDPQGSLSAAAYLPALRAVCDVVWCLDVSALPEKSDAADWTGTDDELSAFLATATPVLDAEAAVAEAQELVRDDYAERRKEKLSARSVRRDGWGELVDAVLHWDKMATALSGCKQSWMKTVCNGCGTRPAFVLSCHEPLCPNCYAGRMIAHWRVQMHEIGKHERFRFLILTPNDLVPDEDKGRFKRLRERFKYARNKAYLNDGIYGVVNSRLYGQQIIWALPAACEPPTSLGSFDVELVGEGRIWDACFWFIDRYDAEMDEFLTGERPDEDELRDFIAETKQRHRYTGIGKFYPTFSPSDPSTTSGVNDEVKPINLGLIRGGSGNGVGKKLGQTCPFCEVGRLSRYAERAGPTEIREEVHNGHTHACWVPRSDHNILRQ